LKLLLFEFAKIAVTWFTGFFEPQSSSGSALGPSEHSAMSTAARLPRVAIGLPTALLLLVACAQMILTRTDHLSPWKGGGFGMFASVDGLPFRWVRL
jgi:hypothetical protein